MATTLWHPLKQRTFRNLLIADVVSDVGTFMQSVGAAWLMVSLNAGPLYVALTQTAAALTFFLLALPAGAIGDIVDRRRLILSTETWMVGIAILLAALTLAGLMSPALLLVLTFALSAGDAFETPTWRSILPELVDEEDLAAASALNGIEFNFARAVGPGIAGVVIAAAGVGAAFLLNAVSFIGVLVVIVAWKRVERKRTLEAERVMEAMGAAIRYVRYSPPILRLLVRNGSFVFFASALLSLLPSLARSMKNSPLGYGLLLGAFGFGAVAGALLMQGVRSRWPTEAVVTGAIVLFGVGMIALFAIDRYLALFPFVLAAGSCWVIFNSVMNVAVLGQAPDWVRARVLAAYQLVFQGSIALGSTAWGFVAQRAGLPTAFLCAGIGMLGTAVLALFLRMPDADGNKGSWDPWRIPSVDRSIEAEIVEPAGVLVTIEYEPEAAQTAAFLLAVRQLRRIRRRDGARRWGIFQDVERPQLYLETFVLPSWLEHLRQHERLTQADKETFERLSKTLRKPSDVRHRVSLE